MTKKLGIIMLIMAFFFGSSTVYAVAAPTLKIKKQKDTSVTLQVVATEFAKKEVKVKVKIEDQDNDSSTTKVFETKLSRTGKADIKIDGLTKDIEYSFKAMIKKSSGGSYSSYSDTVTVNGSGDDSYSVSIDTTDVSSNAFVLKVTSAGLKKKDVKIKVRIENEDTDKIETRVFSKKLDSKGKAKITIDGLSGDTDYAIKAAIKKKKGDAYSSFTGKESITTD